MSTLLRQAAYGSRANIDRSLKNKRQSPFADGCTARRKNECQLLRGYGANPVCWHSAQVQRVQSASKLCEAAYDAAASSVDAPMMLRNLISSRDSSRETCIWLMPSSWAMSDCERCSK
jgi:hypothetical protein